MPRELEKALLLAAAVHAGQRDKAGAPYILHPIRVMQAMAPYYGEVGMVAGILHDTLEDTETTVADLRRCGVPEDAIAAVEVVTKRPEEETNYVAFIERIATSGNRLAIALKDADLADNMDLTRLGHPPTRKDEARTFKYQCARERLALALELTP